MSGPCKHGANPRQCYTCELEARIAELEAEVAEHRMCPLDQVTIELAEARERVAARDACIEAYEEAYNTIKGATDPFHATTIRQADKEIAEARRKREALT